MAEACGAGVLQLPLDPEEPGGDGSVHPIRPAHVVEEPAKAQSQKQLRLETVLSPPRPPLDANAPRHASVS